MQLSSSIRFALVLAALFLALGSDCCPPREKSDEIHTEQRAENLVQEVNDHFLKRIIRYYLLGGVLQAIHEKYPDIPRLDIVAAGPSQVQDRSSGKGNTIHASHFIRVGQIDERLRINNETLHTALKNFIGKTEDMNRCWNDWWSIGGKVDKFQSSNLALLAEINFRGRLQGANKVRVVKLVEKYQKIINEYDRRRSDTRFNYREEYWTITHVLKAQEIASKIQDGAMLFQEGKNGYQSVNDWTFVTTWNPNA